MTHIRVRYFGPLREIIDKRNEKVSIDDSASLMDLLEKLVDRHGSKFRTFVFQSDGEIREGIAFAVDGDTIPKSRLQKIHCTEAEEFVILPPISGGTLSGIQSKPRENGVKLN